MSDTSPLAEYGFIGGVAAGLGWFANFIWRKVRPDEPLPIGRNVVTPADVHERLDEIDRRLDERFMELTKQFELFVQEERQIHPHIIGIVSDIRTELGKARDSISSIALEIAKMRRPMS